MEKLGLEKVFKRSGMPTYTFVKPDEYTRLLVALRTAGRCVVVEGPSGIGKTTAVLQAIDELGLKDKALILSARKKEDVDLIDEITSMKEIGMVVIDDFHRLGEENKEKLSNFMKYLADSESETSKVVVLGINKAGHALINMAPDLRNRIDVIKFYKNTEEKIRELILKGEKALNVSINVKEDTIENSQGSFHIAQMLCHEACLMAGILNEQEKLVEISVSFETLKDRILEELRASFFDLAKAFATGQQLKKSSRAPYLHILYWLATEDEWSINIDHLLSKYPKHKPSVGQVVDRGHLKDHLIKTPQLSEVIHFDPATNIISIEDPKFAYYIRNILWSKFAKNIGFHSVEFASKYDFALSFAGSDRAIAESVSEKLIEAEIAVFYDKNEQARILASNVEEYLAPIYSSEARYIIVLLGKDYPLRIWTKFESEQFKGRFGDNAVIPVWFSNNPMGMFDSTKSLGGYTLNDEGDIESQINDFVATLLQKIGNDRIEEGQLSLL